MSLKLYYTGSVKFDKPQVDAMRSLGGYISSSEIPNGLLGNMFGDISKLTIQQNRPEIRVFAIKNVGVAPLTNLKCWFVYPDDGAIPTPALTNDFDYEIGFISPEADDCGDLLTEKITNIYASPYTVTMNANKVGEVNALMLGALDPDDYLCIFIRRRMKAALLQPMNDTDMLAVLEGTKVLPEVEDITLTFGWD